MESLFQFLLTSKHWFTKLTVNTSNQQEFKKKEMFHEVPKNWTHISQYHLVNIPQNVAPNENYQQSLHLEQLYIMTSPWIIEIHVSRESTYEPSLPVGGNTSQLDMNYLYTCTRVVVNMLRIFISTQSLSLLMI